MLQQLRALKTIPEADTISQVETIQPLGSHMDAFRPSPLHDEALE